MEIQRGSKKRGRSSINLADLNIDSDDSGDRDDASLHSSTDDEDNETDLATKKVRMARQYLERIEAADQESEEDEEDVEDEQGEDGDGHLKLTRRLRNRRLEQTGKLETILADKISQQLSEIHQNMAPKAAKYSSIFNIAEREAKAWVEAGYVRLLRGHDLALTCVALQNDASRALSGSKDHSVLLWDVETSRKLNIVCSHWKKHNSSSSSSRTDGQVLSVACSHDGRYAAVGSRDGLVRIFDIRLNNPKASSNYKGGEGPPSNMVKEFRGHKGAVSFLCFQESTMQLFSASEDRCIRSYNLDEMVQLETLYGHQLGVTSIDCCQKERPVSVGRDRTARLWKLAEDTHMVYRGGSLVQPSECVSIVRDDWFITGHDDGQLSLWLTEKKKPVVAWDHAHGAVAGINRPIVCIRAVRRSDLLISGSCDGFMRLWKIRTGSSKAEGRDISECGHIPIHGYINAVAVGPNAKFALLAVGNEHRMGRWTPIAKAKNRLAFVHLSANSTDGQ